VRAQLGLYGVDARVLNGRVVVLQQAENFVCEKERV